jgi:DNA-binding NarL/FixJ family response regulator
LNALLELERREGELTVEKLQHRQAQREAEFVKQQNDLMQASIEQRNNLIDEFQKAIKRMESSDTRRKEVFKGLHEKINTVRRSSIETAAYDTKFNTVHQERMQKLQILFPAITFAEAKVAVMLSSGLSNKEIAAITLTTPRNIELHRLKLRQKLNLKTGQDLLEKLSAILSA